MAAGYVVAGLMACSTATDALAAKATDDEGLQVLVDDLGAITREHTKFRIPPWLLDVDRPTSQQAFTATYTAKLSDSQERLALRSLTPWLHAAQQRVARWLDAKQRLQVGDETRGEAELSTTTLALTRLAQLKAPLENTSPRLLEAVNFPTWRVRDTALRIAVGEAIKEAQVQLGRVAPSASPERRLMFIADKVYPDSTQDSISEEAVLKLWLQVSRMHVEALHLKGTALLGQREFDLDPEDESSIVLMRVPLLRFRSEGAPISQYTGAAVMNSCAELGAEVVEHNEKQSFARGVSQPDTWQLLAETALYEDMASTSHDAPSRFWEHLYGSDSPTEEPVMVEKHFTCDLIALNDDAAPQRALSGPPSMGQVIVEGFELGQDDDNVVDRYFDALWQFLKATPGT